MSKRVYLVIAVGVIAAVLSFDLVMKWWLARDVGGTECGQFTQEQADASGLDFTPRFTEEKQILKFEIRTAKGQNFPACFISNTAFRCNVEGPAMVRTKVWRDRRYFDVGKDETMTIAGTEDYVLCGVAARAGIPVP